MGEFTAPVGAAGAAEGEESSGKAGDDAPRPYTPWPQGLYLAQIYWKRPAIVVLRALQLLFTMIALSVMADVLRDAYNTVETFQYTLAVSVLAFLYALAQISLSVWSIVRGGTRSTSDLTPAYQFATFILDQAFAYFLFSSGSSTAGAVRLLGVCEGSNYCSRLTGCLAFVFLAFAAFAACAAFTGFHLARCILKA